MGKDTTAIKKALDKSHELARKGKYDAAIRVLVPYRSDSHVRKMIENTKNLKKAVKDLQSHPLHPKQKRGCWLLRF